ncbi:hypothetical protein EGT74_07785 [Chitinophaga lutea]|uniref:Lipocalin-like domain-containing protein n=1 Tax=Chitinophaga lutea TaxID=2488634 RepID=A0A3N4QP10_9BACT|nr:lipocalin family protein [Chitinophaga lutea]RPE13414.1 hypothetical protein EGT74_07785 [Chitinophaga lutea]
MRTLILLFAAALMGACSSRSDNNAPGSVPAGTWRVTHFSERGSDETGDFSGYVFTFAANGSATAVKATTSKTGSWSMSSNNTRFNIDFGAKTDANKPLGELTDDWVIISITNNEIKLTDDNTSSAEFLTFGKN